MTDQETILYYYGLSELLASKVRELHEELEQVNLEYIRTMKETTATINQAADTIRAMAWVVSQFIPTEDLYEWVELGALALLERSFQESGTEPETP